MKGEGARFSGSGSGARKSFACTSLGLVILGVVGAGCIHTVTLDSIFDDSWSVAVRMVDGPQEILPGVRLEFSPREGLDSGAVVHWAFGDGRVADGWAVVHSYAAPGSYRVVASAEGREAMVSVGVSDVGRLEGAAPITAEGPFDEPQDVSTHVITLHDGFTHGRLELSAEKSPRLLTLSARIVDPSGTVVDLASSQSARIELAFPASASPGAYRLDVWARSGVDTARGEARAGVLDPVVVEYTGEHELRYYTSALAFAN